ncbi:MAG: hypothetical protein JW390_20285 [Nitrosopumilus sp.]|nr:hypothetical protein [Candidatus Nitrosopumilus limneticus]
MFFISIKNTKNTLVSKEKCAICNGKIQLRYKPMDEWGIKGTMCGKCYSKKVHEHYPGEHARVNLDLD